MDLSFDKDDKLLKKYSDVWNKFSNSINQNFDNKHIYNKNFLKTKIKSYGDEIFMINKFLNKDLMDVHKCFLNERKCIEKERKVVRYITEDLQISSDDSDDSMKN